MAASRRAVYTVGPGAQERPSIARVLEAQKALPSDDQVAKVKRLGRWEVTRVPRKQFQELDKNKDGTLQFEEMKQMLQALNRNLAVTEVLDVHGLPAYQ